MWMINVPVTRVTKILKLEWNKSTFFFIMVSLQKIFVLSWADSWLYYRTKRFFKLSALPCSLFLCCVYCSLFVVIVRLVKPLILIPCFVTNTGLRVIDNKFKIVAEPHAAAWLSECTQAFCTNRIWGLRVWASLEHMSLFAYILVCMQTFVMEHFKIQEFYRICCTQNFSTRSRNGGTMLTDKERDER